MRYHHLTSNTRAILKDSTQKQKSVGNVLGDREHLHSFDRLWVVPNTETSKELSKMIKNRIFSDYSSGYTSKWHERPSHENICKTVIIPRLVTFSKVWKKQKWLSE